MAIEANANRALYGKFDSTMNMKGASVIEKPNEAIEKIFSFRKVVVRGPA
jgi:hypothetical protein